jgi:hypothetical protein
VLPLMLIMFAVGPAVLIWFIVTMNAVRRTVRQCAEELKGIRELTRYQHVRRANDEYNAANADRQDEG